MPSGQGCSAQNSKLRRAVPSFTICHRAILRHFGEQNFLGKNAPNPRPVEMRPSREATVISNQRLGALHHRYSWREAAWEARFGRLLALCLRRAMQPVRADYQHRDRRRHRIRTCPWHC